MRVQVLVAVVLACLWVHNGRVSASCGDSVVDAGEQCDDGGRCIGGSLAGTSCTSEDACLDGGACFGGMDDLRACDSDEDCRRGTCLRCRPQGGDGCAANCTFEIDAIIDLVDGVIGTDRTSINFGTSGAVLHGYPFRVPLPFAGTLALTAGSSANGVSPIVIKAAGLDVPFMPVGTSACVCVRSPTPMTCGGTVAERDGSLSPNCTPDLPASTECPIERPCAPVHGPGNAGSGFIGCGLASATVESSQDCKGTPGVMACAPILDVDEADDANSDQATALLVSTVAIGTTISTCIGDDPSLGADGVFCTDDDPEASRGSPLPIAFSTGSAAAAILNGFDFNGNLEGPHLGDGRSFSCSDIDGSVDLSDGVLAGGITACDQMNFGDMTGPISLAFGPAPTLPGEIEPTPTPPCAGDCDGDGEVTVDELTILTNVALGLQSLTLCGVGDGDGDGRITIDEIIVAMQRALEGC